MQLTPGKKYFIGSMQLNLTWHFELNFIFSGSSNYTVKFHCFLKTETELSVIAKKEITSGYLQKQFYFIFYTLMLITQTVTLRDQSTVKVVLALKGLIRLKKLLLSQWWEELLSDLCIFLHVLSFWAYSKTGISYFSPF